MEDVDDQQRRTQASGSRPDIAESGRSDIGTSTRQAKHIFIHYLLRHMAAQHNIYKKDGYRQQNVRQRQKLISIIDYDVCILEYLQPVWRYSTLKNGLTLKSGYGVLQGH